MATGVKYNWRASDIAGTIAPTTIRRWLASILKSRASADYRGKEAKGQHRPVVVFSAFFLFVRATHLRPWMLPLECPLREWLARVCTSALFIRSLISPTTRVPCPWRSTFNRVHGSHETLLIKIIRAISDGDNSSCDTRQFQTSGFSFFFF